MAAAKKNNQLIELIINIVIPSLILMKLSAEQYLGTANALLLALAFPLGWGLYDLLRNRKTNFIAILGLVSILLTGGIGLLHGVVEPVRTGEAVRYPDGRGAPDWVTAATGGLLREPDFGATG